MTLLLVVILAQIATTAGFDAGNGFGWDFLLDPLPDPPAIYSLVDTSGQEIENSRPVVNPNGQIACSVIDEARASVAYWWDGSTVTIRSNPAVQINRQYAGCATAAPIEVILTPGVYRYYSDHQAARRCPTCLWEIP